MKEYIIWWYMEMLIVESRMLMKKLELLLHSGQCSNPYQISRFHLIV